MGALEIRFIIIIIIIITRIWYKWGISDHFPRALGPVLETLQLIGGERNSIGKNKDQYNEYVAFIFYMQLFCRETLVWSRISMPLSLHLISNKTALN